MRDIIVYILTLKGKESGVFTVINDYGEQVIPIFEEYDDADRYNIMIDDISEKNLPLKVTEVEKTTICMACIEREQKYAIITSDDLLIPPEKLPHDQF